MKKVSIYVRNINYGPSCFYRMGQYYNAFNADVTVHSVFNDHDFKKYFSIKNKFIKAFFKIVMLFRSNWRAKRFFKEDIKNNIDVIIVQRNICPRLTFPSTLKKEKKLLSNTTLIWDFDDNIIQSGEIYKKDYELFETKAKNIIISQPFLLTTLKPSVHEKVIILPTTDFLVMNHFKNYKAREREQSYDSNINLVWIGTKGNLIQLDNVINCLDEASVLLKKECNKSLHLIVVTDQEYKPDVTSLIIEYVPWSRDQVNKQMEKAHIGIMPLIDTQYTRGKAGFKLVQYLAAKLPIIGSNVGYNSEIVNVNNGFLIDEEKKMEQWKVAIYSLSCDINTWKKYSEAALKTFMDKFNPEKTVDTYNKILEDL